MFFTFKAINGTRYLVFNTSPYNFQAFTLKGLRPVHAVTGNCARAVTDWAAQQA